LILGLSFLFLCIPEAASFLLSRFAARSPFAKGERIKSAHRTALLQSITNRNASSARASHSVCVVQDIVFCVRDVLHDAN